MAFADGREYAGEWASGRPEGYGILRLPGGAGEYNGPFVAGRRHGPRGSLEVVGPDGRMSTSVGTWLDDRMGGAGYQTWDDGARYDGEFAAVRPRLKLLNRRTTARPIISNMSFCALPLQLCSGRATACDALLRVRVAHQYRRREGRARRKVKHNNMQSKKSGAGRMQYADGSLYVGEWRADQRSGQVLQDYLELIIGEKAMISG